MNCFEARQNFRSFWRKELAPESRAAFLAHLAECSKCDGAFRTFALTAPVFHSEAEPAARRVFVARVPARAHRDGNRYRTFAGRTSVWVSIAAVVALFLTGASAAYYSVKPPTETLSDAIHQPSQSVELVSAESPETNSDFGQ